MDHDQNFKNLILDYPRQAIEWFAAAHAAELRFGAVIKPVRQEQLQDHLGSRYRELDVHMAHTREKGRGLRPRSAGAAGTRAGLETQAEVH